MFCEMVIHPQQENKKGPHHSKRIKLLARVDVALQSRHYSSDICIAMSRANHRSSDTYIEMERLRAEFASVAKPLVCAPQNRASGPVASHADGTTRRLPAGEKAAPHHERHTHRSV